MCTPRKVLPLLIECNNSLSSFTSGIHTRIAEQHLICWLSCSLWSSTVLDSLHYTEAQTNFAVRFSFHFGFPSEMKHFVLTNIKRYFTDYRLFLQVYHNYLNANAVFKNNCISSQIVILSKLHKSMFYIIRKLGNKYI